MRSAGARNSVSRKKHAPRLEITGRMKRNKTKKTTVLASAVILKSTCTYGVKDDVIFGCLKKQLHDIEEVRTECDDDNDDDDEADHLFRNMYIAVQAKHGTKLTPWRQNQINTIDTCDFL